jgi:hypothetical protein
MSNRKVWMVAALSLLGATNAVAQSNTKASTGAQGAPLGSSWDDIKKMPDFFTGVWQSRGGMVDGYINVGYTEKAKAYIKNYKPAVDIPLANSSCKSVGMPIVMRAQSPLKFMYEPGMIAIYMEQASDTRFIFMNEKLPTSPNPTYLGNSVGHWEGDTLVIESVGFADDITFQYGAKQGYTMPWNRRGGPGGPPGGGPGAPGAPGAAGPGAASPSAGGRPGGAGGVPGDGSFLSYTIFGPHGPNLRMVERMRLTDPDTLEWKLTVYDPSVFTGPYEAEVHPFKRIRGPKARPQEWVCTASISYYDEKTNKHEELDPEEALKLLDSQIIK